MDAGNVQREHRQRRVRLLRAEKIVSDVLSVDGVLDIEKCRVRKSGLGLLMDIHVVVGGEATVRECHEIAHAVKDLLSASRLRIVDVVVHIEPDDAGTREG